MGPFTTVYNTIEVFYSEIKLAVNHLNYTTSLKSKINGLVNWQQIEAQDKKLINEYYKLEPLPFRIIYNSLYVSIVAGFENFLREFLFVLIQEKGKAGKLSDAFLKKHLQLSGIILSYTFTMPSHLNIDTYKIGKNLASCTPQSTPFTLNPEIAYFVKNILEIEKVLDFLTSCGVNIQIDAFGRNADLVSLLKTTNPRETVKELQEKMDEYVKNRHKIAHTGLDSSEITPSIINETIAVLLAVAKTLILETLSKIK
ncbi:hypothetical protein ABIC45_002710 [Mucilaginibacter rubeus]|uniref:HEPN domain-containing protein n=1 Tax=Mucilaginibacter rubeus TaxID=2027860 RepID=UPI00339996AF